jgi:hypothetical protein
MYLHVSDCRHVGSQIMVIEPTSTPIVLVSDDVALVVRSQIQVSVGRTFATCVGTPAQSLPPVRLATEPGWRGEPRFK